MALSCFLLVNVLPVYRFTASDYPFGLFKPFLKSFPSLSLSLSICNCSRQLPYVYNKIIHAYIVESKWGGIMVLNGAFNNIAVILWRSVLLIRVNRNTLRKPLTCRKSLSVRILIEALHHILILSCVVF